MGMMGVGSGISIPNDEGWLHCIAEDEPEQGNTMPLTCPSCPLSCGLPQHAPVTPHSMFQLDAAAWLRYALGQTTQRENLLGRGLYPTSGPTRG